MTAMIIIITIIIPTLSATVCMCVCVWFIRYPCVCVCDHMGLKILYASLQDFFLRTLFICIESRHDITSSSFCFS